MESPADASMMSRRSRWLTKARANFLIWRAVLMLVAAAALFAGVKLRWHCYADSEAFRFKGDISNGWHQGTEIYKAASVVHYARVHGGATTLPTVRVVVSFKDYFRALRGRYDALFLDNSKGDDYGLDYPPARLLIMSSWVWHARVHAPRPLPQPFDFQLAKPLLRLNTTLEALAAVAGFLIVRRVLKLDGSRHGATCGLIAALLIWFTPSVLLDGHVWPQWDVWLPAFYLWACWMGLRGNWLMCGALLALGAMCKGQMLLIAPALMLWPLLRGDLRATGDWLLGFFAAGLAFASPWLLNNADAIRMALQLSVPALLAVGCARRLDWRWVMFALIGTVLLSGVWAGSIAWYFVGFAYGARHYHMMLHIGTIPNLAAILANQYGWGPEDTMMHIAGHALTTREVLFNLGLAGIGLSGIALALQSRRRDRRILLALALPWLSAACLLPQMHERYLLWAAVASALAVGVSLGATLLHAMIAIWATFPIAVVLLEQVDRAKPSPASLAAADRWHILLRNSWPGSASAVLTLLLIWMYLSLMPSRRGRARLVDGLGSSISP